MLYKYMKDIIIFIKQFPLTEITYIDMFCTFFYELILYFECIQMNKQLMNGD